MRDFNFGNHEETLLLHHRVRALNLVFSDLGREFRKSRDIQIKITVMMTVTHGVSGPHTFRGGYHTVSVVIVTVVPFVVTTFVSTKSLSSGEGLVADGALMGTTAGGGRTDGAGGSDARGGRLVVGHGEFPVAGLVSPESLVRGEGFVTNRAFVGEFGERIWGGVLWR